MSANVGVVVPAGRRSYHTAFVLIFAALLVALATSTISSLHSRWLELSYSHGYLIVGAVVALIALEARGKPLPTFAPSLFGAAILAAATLAVLAAHAVSVIIVAQLALPILLIGAVWTFIGCDQTKRFLPAIAFLYFGIPFWDYINEPLRQLTVLVVTEWIRAADIPAFIDGNVIHIPSGVFEVAGGCSGLHFAVVALALAALTGLVNQTGWRNRVTLIVCSLVLALLANWIRVFSIVAVGHLTEMQHSIIDDGHYTFGWIVFVVCFSPVYWLDRWLQKRPQNAPARATPVALRASRSRSGAAPWLAVVVLATGAALGHRLPSEAPLAEGDVPPLSLGVWRVSGLWSDEGRPLFVGVSREGAHWYRHAESGERLGAYVAHYSRQGQAREVVSSANRPEGAASSVTSVERRLIPVADNRTLAFKELEVMDTAGGRRLVWIHTRIAGMATTNDMAAKALQLVGLVRGRSDGQVVVLTAQCASGCASSRRLLAEYASVAVEPLLESAVDRPTRL